jgi:hypothetical protein
VLASHLVIYVARPADHDIVVGPKSGAGLDAMKALRRVQRIHPVISAKVFEREHRRVRTTEGVPWDDGHGLVIAIPAIARFGPPRS